jgi:hypothetical protein
MKLPIFLFLTLLLFSGISSYGQISTANLEQQIKTYFTSFPQEKVFLETDKELYKPGETIWFRSFVFDSNSQAAATNDNRIFIGLYDKTGSLVKKDMYRLSEGAAFGDVAIPETLQTGTYFLVAYTSPQSSGSQFTVVPILIDPLVRDRLVVHTALKDSISVAGKSNEMTVSVKDLTGKFLKNKVLNYEFRRGQDIIQSSKVKTDEQGNGTIVFTVPDKSSGEPLVCSLADSKSGWSKEVFIPTNLDPLHIQFFPEGGNLIAGIPTRIGFTAFNKWGMPVNTEGSLVDSNGEKVASLKTISKGLGIFSLNIPENKKYKLLISGTNGQDQTFDLPLPQKNGLALSIGKTDSRFISTALNFSDNQKHTVSVFVTQGGHICWTADIEVDGAGDLKIPTGKLSPGVNLISVFSKEGDLLANRLVYNDYFQKVKVDILPEKSNIRLGEKTKVKVRLTSEDNRPVSGNISVTVSDVFRKYSTARQRLDDIMITSDLETPLSVIPKPQTDKIENSPLDIYMIANSLKSFNWTNIRKFKPENAVAIKAKNLIISGFVTDKIGRKMSKANVVLVETKTGKKYTATTNSGGVFTFPELKMGNINNYTAKAEVDGEKNTVSVNFMEGVDGEIASFINRNRWQFDMSDPEKTFDENYLKNNESLFAKVPKSATKIDRSYEQQKMLLANSTNLMDVIKAIKPFRVNNNQIVFLGSENSINYQGGALIVLDGHQVGTDISVIENLSPADVDHIKVSTNPMDIQRYTGLNSVGIIEIFQKKGKIDEVEPAKTPTTKYDGEFRIPASFNNEAGKNDNRTTLVWIPDQKVDSSGEFEFTITGGKVLSDFVIDIQCIADDYLKGSGFGKITVVK